MLVGHLLTVGKFKRCSFVRDTYTHAWTLSQELESGHPEIYHSKQMLYKTGLVKKRPVRTLTILSQTFTDFC